MALGGAHAARARLLDGFRRGWRKDYVELLDAATPDLLASLVASGGSARLTAIEQQGWEFVVGAYDYDIGDDGRRHAVALVRGLVAQLAEPGIPAVADGDAAITPLGTMLSFAVSLALDEDEEKDGL